MAITSLRFLEKEAGTEKLVSDAMWEITEKTVDNLMKCMDFYCHLPAKSLLAALFKLVNPHKTRCEFFEKLKAEWNKLEHSEMEIIVKTLDARRISRMTCSDIEDLLRGRHGKQYRMDISPQSSVNPHFW